MSLQRQIPPKKRILVVDAEKVTRVTFESILTRAGYDVTTAANLDEALKAMSRKRFHAVLADIVRGKGPALDLLSMQNGAVEETPLVVIDRDDNSESATTCLALGACHYLVKPVHTEELIRVMRELLG
jgi:DNA-binding NtrC family response regulator